MAGSMSLDGASWSWIEKFQKATKLNDSLTGIIIGLLIILPFIAIEVQNGYYSIHSEDEIALSVIRLITCIAEFIAIIYLIRGVLYIIHILKNMPDYINIAADGSSVESNKSYLTIDSFGLEVRKRFSDKRKYYCIISLILVPFIALDIWVYLFVRPDIDITNYNDFISFINSNRYLIIFDVYNKSIAYFMEYLIAYMIWTIMN
ncbi:MAG: hypothetical protein PHY05_07110, partial [Methanothrix sp.]|nr:hypothetical protein [Methanothrix sp.]